MKILHINSLSEGGAAKAAFGLQEALIKKDIESKYLFLYGKTNEKSDVFKFKIPQFSYFKSVANRLGIKVKIEERNQKKIEGYKESNYIFSFPQSSINIFSENLLADCDIVHLHWPTHFIDYKLFFQNINKPVVWTLHDMNAFTGGCHHSSGCKKYMQDCSECPMLQGLKNNDLAKKNLRYKRESLKKFTKLDIVALNTWMNQASQNSYLFKNFRHHIIANSTDLSLFKILDSKFARSLFNISDSKIIFGFVSSYQALGKGYDLLAVAMKKLEESNKNIQLVYIGEKVDELSSQNVVYKGKITDEKLLPIFYNAIDGLIVPSKEDNFPNVVLEAFACGKPVLSFTVGGLPDMITSPELGILMGTPSVVNLISGIEKYISCKSNYNAVIIRRNSEKKYSPQLQAEKYISLYKQVLETK
jgi:glycosyltransferase involved in cell wall biosynthesis